MLRISTSQAALVCLLALILAVPAAATHESVTYDAPPVDLLVPYDPPPVCIGPQAKSSPNQHLVDPARRCVDPDPVQLPYTYDAPPVQVSIPHPEPPPLPPPPSEEEIILTDQRWQCEGLVDRLVDPTPDGHLALVKVTMTLNAPVLDAIRLYQNCTGSIDRIEVETWQADGVKAGADSTPPFDVTINGGYIICHGHEDPAIHQDGVQVMGGRRLTFRNLTIDCDGSGNSPFFVAAAVGGQPEDVLLLNSVIKDTRLPGGGVADEKATALRIEESLRSGARNVIICPGRYFWSVYQPPQLDAAGVPIPWTGAIDPVGSTWGNNRANLEGNTMTPRTDPNCA
jgi:hypothetical protein